MMSLLLDSFYQTNLSDLTIQTYSQVDDFVAIRLVLPNNFK